MSRRIVKILPAVTVTGAAASSEIAGMSNTRTYQAALTGTGTLAATVLIQGSIDNVNWTTLATLTLTDAAPVTGSTSIDAYVFARANVTVLTGTAASVLVNMAA